MEMIMNKIQKPKIKNSHPKCIREQAKYTEMHNFLIIGPQFICKMLYKTHTKLIKTWLREKMNWG